MCIVYASSNTAKGTRQMSYTFKDEIPQFWFTYLRYGPSGSIHTRKETFFTCESMTVRIDALTVSGWTFCIDQISENYTGKYA